MGSSEVHLSFFELNLVGVQLIDYCVKNVCVNI